MSQLGFDFGVEQPRPLVRVSPARLGTFDRCALLYRMTYLDRPQPQRTGPWASSTLGAVVHNALRALFELPPDRRTPSRAAALVGEYWKDAGFADQTQAALYRERAKAWVVEYVEHHDITADPVGLEWWLSATVDTRTAGSLLIEGRADRIDRRDGELVVVDYKTGRKPPEERTARESQALALYAVVAERTMRRRCHTVELHHLPTGTVAAAEHSDDSLDDHLTRAARTADALASATATLAEGGDAERLFPASPGPACGWCDFRPSCPAGQRAAPAARSWDLLAP